MCAFRQAVWDDDQCCPASELVAVVRASRSKGARSETGMSREFAVITSRPGSDSMMMRVFSSESVNVCRSRLLIPSSTRLGSSSSRSTRRSSPTECTCVAARAAWRHHTPQDWHCLIDHACGGDLAGQAKPRLSAASCASRVQLTGSGDRVAGHCTGFS